MDKQERQRRLLGGIVAGAEIILPPYGDEFLAPAIFAGIAYGHIGKEKNMAVDVTDIGRTRDNSLAGTQDTEIARKMMLIAGAALVLLVAIHLGFFGRVFA